MACIARMGFWVVAILFFQSVSFAAEWKEIKTLKKLYLSTKITEKQMAKAVIVSPAGGAYDGDARRILEAVARMSGVPIQRVDDTVDPVELLRRQNVIVLGNMATNVFIEKLYRQWQVILDLKYPGPGGYVVRTLHNPFGTGHNVIFIGGSDEEGVNKATNVFLEELKPGKTLSVGWLMKIKLGPDQKLPEIGAFLKEWQVYSWRDSWRKTSYLAYHPSTYFGWNPISIAGVLYYMTGRKEYLDTFKELAMPDPEHIPLQNQVDESFNDPLNPLVKNYHYRSHLVDCVYDLIEESPLFTDRERLFITNKLLDHQREYDPDSTYSAPNPDRHQMWQMLNIYTGSRYFATYYHDKVWDRRLENVRRSFRTFIKNPAWGEEDTLQWLSTFLEPVFEFFLMEGSEEFVQSGTARIMMNGLEALMSGNDMDYYNSSISISLLHKAAYLMKDGRYIWMARQLGFDFDTFRIGQSYWPKVDLVPEPPSDLVGRTIVYPPADFGRENSDSPMEKMESFQILSYRSGLGKNDDYLLLDGFNGLGAHPYQLNTLLRLRMFNGKSILDGYGNDLFVWRNGLTDDKVPRNAHLKNHFEMEGLAYIQSEVPDISSSRWERQILYRKDQEAVVIDRITASENGEFDVRCFWQLGSPARKLATPSRAVVSANGARLSSSESVIETLNEKELVEHVARKLNKGQSFSFANLFNNESRLSVISPITDGAYRIDGNEPSLIFSGTVADAGVSVKGEFLVLDENSLFLAAAKELLIHGVSIFRADTPATLFWNFKEKKLIVKTDQPANYFLASDDKREFAMPAGEYSFDDISLEPRLAAMMREILKKPEVVEGLPQKTTDTKPVTRPVWRTTLPEKITDLQFVNRGAGEFLLAVSSGKKNSSVADISDQGSITRTIRLDEEILSFHAANSLNQEKSFAFLAGFKNDQVRAYSSDGKEVWRFKAEIDASFRIGARYEAPWFTDPGPTFNMTGIYSLWVGDIWRNGQEEIVLGRPSTIEFHSLDGGLLARVPARWGNVTSLVPLKSGNGKGAERLLAGKYLAGKAALSSISGSRKNLTDDSFSELPSGVVNMHAFGQQGVYRLIAADIDNDGVDEIVYSVKGHWNEIRAYDQNGHYLWRKHLGPDKGEKSDSAGFLAAVDLNGDRRREIVFSAANGWIGVLDSRGASLWLKRLEASVSALAVDESTKMIAVGCSNGDLFIVDANGNTKLRGKVDSSVTKIAMKTNGIYLGTEHGAIYKYNLQLN